MVAAAAMKGRVNGITGVRMEKVDEEHLRKVAADLKIVEDDSMPIETLVVAVAQHFVDKTAKADLVECDVCKGKSDLALDACPFCGTVEDSTSSGSASVDKPAPVTTPEAKAPKLADPAPADKPKIEKEAQMGSKKAAAPKAEKPAKAGKAEKPAKAALAVVDDTKASSAIVTERELDAKIKEVQALKGAAAVSYWHLGIKIKEIYDLQAWKQRNDPATGKPKYKGFDPFVHHELQMTPANAYKLMDIAKNFSQVQVAAFGTTKLGLILEAPVEDRARILDHVEKTGASKREVEKEVRKVRKEKNYTKESRGKKMPKGKPPQKQSITVANMIGRKTVKLFAKPANYKKGDDLAGAKRATKIAHVPFGVNDLENDVKQSYTLQETPSGEWALVVETWRTGG